MLRSCKIGQCRQKSAGGYLADWFYWGCDEQAGQGPLATPSFTQVNPGGVIDIPTNAFIAIDANGPDVVLTAQLTGIRRWPKQSQASCCKAPIFHSSIP